MENYQIIEKIGSGSDGVVSKAINKNTDEVVAIKKLMTKYDSWEECMKLREVKALVKMNNHKSFVNLKEICKEGDFLYMIFEYMECNLFQLIKRQSESFSETTIRDMCFPVFQGLAHMHGQGFLHRDLKPENLLVNKDVIKIGDLGSARNMDGGSLDTDYVTTRLYRAPEVLLGSKSYDHKVDMWAMGVIMAELFTLQTLFQAESDAGMLFNICCMLGTPTKSTWSEGHTLATMIKYRFPESARGKQFSEILPSASPELVNLISGLVSWNPSKRPNAMEVLQHPFFSSYHVSRPLQDEPPNLNSSIILRQSTSNLSADPSPSSTWDSENWDDYDPTPSSTWDSENCDDHDHDPSPSNSENWWDDYDPSPSSTWGSEIWDGYLGIDVLFKEWPTTTNGESAETSTMGNQPEYVRLKTTFV